MKEKKKVFYGWYVVAACFVILAAVIGIAWNCLSQFILPICEDLGYTRPQVAFNQTVLYGGYLVLSLLAGKIFKMFNMHSLMKVGSLLVPLSWFLFSRGNSLPWLYASIALSTIGIFAVGMMPIAVILSNWFHEKQGFVIGLTFMGSGVGGMIFNSLTGVLLKNYGWRVAAMVLALCMLVIVVPCVFFVVRVNPGQMGLKPLGAEQTKTGTAVQQELSGLTFNQTLKTKKFWVVCVVIVASALPLNMLIQTLNPHLRDANYSVTFAANMTALSMGALAIGKFFLGVLNDKMGVRGATVLAVGASAVGLFGLYFVGNTPLMLGFVFVGVGLGCSFGSVSLPILSSKVFGKRAYQSIYGVISAASSLGGMFAPMLSNGIYQSFGSYKPVFVGGAAVSIVCAIIFFVVLSGKSSNSETV